ncbi:hypothetical protein CRX72_03855 [Pantoea sp. BRM17]|nr:hypothetical protein CRX72_03855 [Pantoea sp. BRM17]
MIKLGIVMDPISSINIKKDTSFAMLLEAQRRGYEIHYMEMGDLRVRLLIGPEGGLSAEEIAMTAQQGFTDILLGPRVLRTETTALTAITALQVRFGDLG